MRLVGFIIRICISQLAGFWNVLHVLCFEVTKILMYVWTVSFQHGELIPEKAHELKCKILSCRRTRENVVRVSADSHIVFGGSVPAAGSQLSCNLIALRNKRTNKVRYYPFKQYATSCVDIFTVLLLLLLLLKLQCSGKWYCVWCVTGHYCQDSERRIILWQNW